MQIKVKLFATLREGRGKEVMVDFKKGTTPRAIIDALNIPVEEVAILLINGRDGKLDQTLIRKDDLSIFPPVGGA